MILFLVGLLILAAGYFFYGKLAEKIFSPDQRKTPAERCADGVDYVKLPQWKNMLIQLLNIAGIGPVIGVIIGIKFGVIVFLIIPIGNIIGGAVHDFAAGMMSLRRNGANLPAIIDLTCGEKFGRFFSIFMTVCLLLVVAVFINVPAQLVSTQLTSLMDLPQNCPWLFWSTVCVIFLYYIIATLFPVDKIIGTLYPVFGMLLLVGTAAIFVKLMIDCAADPSLLTESAAFKAGMFKPEKTPILPMLFTTIACGILSGFHATQSPIIARTMKSETEARASFYGMMVLEGIIAMVWAGAALALFNLAPETMKINANAALSKITTHFLGSGVGGITVLSVIILAITSGDTALRSLRLSIADKLKVDQRSLAKRFSVTLPLIVIVALLLWWSNQSAETFNKLWTYFAWGNQVLAVCTLTAATVWMAGLKRPVFITMIPGVFMGFIVITYFFASKTLGAPLGLPMPAALAQIPGVILSAALSAWAVHRGVTHSKELEEAFQKEL